MPTRAWLASTARLLVAILAAIALVSTASADTTVLVGTSGTAGSTLTGGIKSFTVTNSGSTWTQSDFNSDGWSQTIAAGVGGLAQDIYGNVYAAVNTGTNATRGIRIYRQTGGESVGYLNSTWGSGNLTGNAPDGLVIGPNGQLYATIAFGTGNNKLLSFDTTTLSSGQIQTGQGGTDTGLTGLDTPRGITVASDGNFYIGNRGTRQILRWTGSGTTAAVLATNNTSGANYQGVSWDAGDNRLLTRTTRGDVGTLSLSGTGSDVSIRNTTGQSGLTGVGVAAVEGLVAFTNFGDPNAATPINGAVATAVTGSTTTQTNQAPLLGALYMLVVRDTRLWEGGVGSWATGGSWRQGIGGTTGAATFTDGSGGTSLPSVLTFTGAGGTATNDVSGTVNVGGLNFAPGAGAYTLAGSGFTLAPDANIRNLSTNAQTISADIVLAGDQWVQADPGSSLTISGGISGAAALRKLGSGTLTLSGSNSYSGGTTVAAGTLEIGSGGTTGSVVGNISNNATLIFNRSDALTYSGTISGGGALTKIGSAVLTLSGSNTYSGNTTVSAGVLAISNTTALPGWNVAGRLAVASGAALAVGNSVNDAAVATLLSTGSNFQAGAAIGFDTTAGNRTYAAAIGNTAQGSLGLIKLGSNTLTLSGNNSFTGGTRINDGVLSFANNGLGTSGAVTMNGGTLRWASGNTQDISGRLAFVSGTTATLDTNGNNVTLATGFGGSTSGSLTKAGLGTLTLTGSNEYSGTTTVSAGVLAISNTTALPGWDVAGRLAVASGAALAVGNSVNDAAVATLLSTGSNFQAGAAIGFDTTAGNRTYAAAIGNTAEGSLGLVKLGSGTLTLSGSNSYTGGTTVTAGILAVSSAAALPTSGTVSVATGSQLRIAGNQTFDAPLTLAGEFTTIAGVLVNASGTNTWSGPIGIATPTTRIESAAGTLTISGTITTSGSGNVVFLGDGTTIIDGRVTGSMQPFRSSGGTGIVTLTNPANDFTGGLGIGGNATGATLRLGASEVIPHGTTAGNVRFTGGSSASFGILDLGGFSETINGLEDASAGGGIIDNLVGGSSTLTIGANDTTSTFRGLIRNTQGQVAIVKTGAGVLTLSGSNSYTGGTTISGGRLEIAPAGRLAASGPITINGSTADLRYNASTPLTAPLTFTQGMISGTGTIGTAVTVATGHILAPGNSPGAQAYTSGLTWSPGGSYQWEINDAAGTVGTNWDVINVSGGALDLAGLSSGSRFNLDLITLSGTASGLMANYVDGQSYSFAIATYTSLLLPDGFAGSDLTSLFQLNTGGWLNPLPAPGNFSVVNDADANTINLVIVPEPAGLVLAGLGIAAAAWASRRRRS